jgi:hypothetical protein
MPTYRPYMANSPGGTKTGAASSPIAIPSAAGVDSLAVLSSHSALGHNDQATDSRQDVQVTVIPYCRHGGRDTQ